MINFNKLSGGELTAGDSNVGDQCLKSSSLDVSPILHRFATDPFSVYKSG